MNLQITQTNKNDSLHLSMNEDRLLKVGLAQISPVWLDKNKTIDKIISYIDEAGKLDCELLVFGEGLLPGYPFWLSFSNGAEFNSKFHKEIQAHYISNSVEIQFGDLDSICESAKKNKLAIYLGTIERAEDRGGHSLYCSLVYINEHGDIKSVHRKLQPTYEERLTWAAGDGHGLRVHSLKKFTLGGLNCWENWMPLSRSALYGQGENLHVAVWPGNEYNTVDITRFAAIEGRSYVLGVCSLMSKNDFPTDTPHYEELIKLAPEQMANGGSCIAGPDGNWIIPPTTLKEGLLTAELDFNFVLEERHNFDVAGHYSRPDVTQLTLNQNRQSFLTVEE